jgi:hypothetical protein
MIDPALRPEPSIGQRSFSTFAGLRLPLVSNA